MEKSSNEAVPVVLNISNLGEMEALLLKVARLLKVTKPEILAVLLNSKGEEIETPPVKVQRPEIV